MSRQTLLHWKVSMMVVCDQLSLIFIDFCGFTLCMILCHILKSFCFCTMHAMVVLNKICTIYYENWENLYFCVSCVFFIIEILLHLAICMSLVLWYVKVHRKSLWAQFLIFIYISRMFCMQIKIWYSRITLQSFIKVAFFWLRVCEFGWNNDSSVAWCWVRKNFNFFLNLCFAGMLYRQFLSCLFPA